MGILARMLVLGASAVVLIALVLAIAAIASPFLLFGGVIALMVGAL